ncbi:MAG: hypothetical protein WAQ22_01180 [Candidatus Saccharimonas sp.]
MIEDGVAVSKRQKSRFVILIILTIGIACGLVYVAMVIYSVSGAAQVDLSRPGYQDVRKQADREETTESYPSEGALDEGSLSEFKKLYKERQSKITSNSFDPSVLGDESLQLFATSVDAD